MDHSTQAFAVNSEFKVVRTSEKEQLQGLNDRFASFIDKVRRLEQQNGALEVELAALRRKQQEPPRVAGLYRDELRQLRTHAEELNTERNRALLERDHAGDALRALRASYEDKVLARKDAEQSLKAYRKDVDSATLARLDLERKADFLAEEISFLRRVHGEEMQELSASMAQQAAVCAMDAAAVAKPDLTLALKEIRNQYEAVTAKNLQASEDWYKAKVTALNEQAVRGSEAVRAGKEEVNEFRRQLQSRSLEVEALRGASEALERRRREEEELHGVEIAAMQVRAQTRSDAFTINQLH